jgi:hypothetical protein
MVTTQQQATVVVELDDPPVQPERQVPQSVRALGREIFGTPGCPA